MIKQTLTPERRNRIHSSMIKLAVLGKVAQMEWAAELDVRLAKPELNMFAGRILKDAIAIGNSLAGGPNMTLKVIGNEQVESYAGELYRVVNYFMTLDESQIKAFMDGIAMIQAGGDE